jgi:hypothetical protein
VAHEVDRSAHERDRTAHELERAAHELDRAAHAVHVLAHTTVLASMLTLDAAAAVVARLGVHRRSHFDEVCAASADLSPGVPPEYLNSRL